VLKPAGIRVYCTPVFGQHTPENWMDSWHGIEEVTRQFLKLEFYRLYVLPLSARGDARQYDGSPSSAHQARASSFSIARAKLSSD
jgi:hypothetical protein